MLTTFLVHGQVLPVALRSPFIWLRLLRVITYHIETYYSKIGACDDRDCDRSYNMFQYGDFLGTSQ